MPSAKILVIRLSSLGDVVLTAPVYEEIKRAWADAEIWVLVKPAYAESLAGNPHITKVLPFNGLFKTLSFIRSKKFTHLLDLHNNLRSKILRLFSGIPTISVYRKRAWARRLFVFFGKNSADLKKHVLERYLEAAYSWTGLPAPRRAVILQSSFLGDSVLTIPLAREIKSRWPHAILDVVTLKNSASLFRDSGWVDRVFVEEKKGFANKTWGLLKTARELKEKNFDCVFIPHRSFRSALLGFLARIPLRVGFEKSAGNMFLTHALPFSWSTHDLERNLSLLSIFAPHAALSPQTAYLYAEAESVQKITQRLRQETQGRPLELIGVHPGSVWPTKRWPARKFKTLCLELLKDGYAPILVGGPQDKALCEEIAAGNPVINWAGKTDLGELKALISLLSLFITNDSGPMHIATGLGIPTLAVFGATTKELGFFPYGPRHKVIEQELPCRPCGLHGKRKCPRGHFLCMELTTVQEVRRTAQAMLGLPIA